MTKVVFENEEEVDILALTVFGVSVKDSSKIGFFGTGFKNAVSVILRSGGSIIVYSGEDKYEFSTETKTIRGKDFDVITMNGQSLSFTTDNARTWEPWMAVREILCNCTDESGEYYETWDEVVPEEDTTKVIVDCPAFLEKYRERDDFILNPNKKYLLYSDSNFDVYTGETYNLFYKGIKVFTSLEKPYCYTYNIKTPQRLTEDRTIAMEWSVYYDLGLYLTCVDNENILRRILKCGEGYQEYSFSYSCVNDNNEFITQYVRKNCEGKIDKNIPPNLRDKYATPLKTSISEQPGMLLNKMEITKLSKAKEGLHKAGWYTDKYPIKVVESLGDGIIGFALDDTIYLTKLAFDQGTPDLAATLYEEYIHLDRGVRDYTRDFQNTVIKDLMLFVEKVNEECW